MKRQFSFVFLLASIFIGVNANALFAQYLEFNNYDSRTVELKLARKAGLISVTCAIQDSGQAAFTSMEKYQVSGDSLWNESKYGDKPSRQILFDSANRILFSSGYDFIYPGRISY